MLNFKSSLLKRHVELYMRRCVCAGKGCTCHSAGVEIRGQLCNQLSPFHFGVRFRDRTQYYMIYAASAFTQWSSAFMVTTRLFVVCLRSPAVFNIYIPFVFECVYVCHVSLCHVGSRDQTWQQVPLPTKLSHWPIICFYLGYILKIPETPSEFIEDLQAKAITCDRTVYENKCARDMTRLSYPLYRLFWHIWRDLCGLCILHSAYQIFDMNKYIHWILVKYEENIELERSVWFSSLTWCWCF